MDNKQCSLRIASFNCEGFNEHKQDFIKLRLLLDNDLVFLQEFWLLESTLTKINSLSTNFFSIATSGVNTSEVLHGRPYGGVAILWRKNINWSVKPIKVESKRF